MTLDHLMLLGTTIAISVAAGALAGVGITWKVMDGTSDARVAEALADVAQAEAPADAVAASAAGTTDAVEAALSPEMTRLGTQQALATSSVQVVYAAAVVQGDCVPLQGALAAYSIAVAGSQGKEGSASVNAEEAQQDIGKVLEAMRVDGLCSELTPPPVEPLPSESAP